MNKQEVIEMLESKAVNHYNETSGWTKKIELDIAIDIIAQINEPEKPVIPQFVADMIIERKKQKQDIVTAIRNLSVFKEAFAWIGENEEAFAKAWFYGYEVEEEKLYTARLKLVTYKLQGYINKTKETNNLFVAGSDENNGLYQVHFTQAELEDLGLWDNPAFEIVEVEE